MKMDQTMWIIYITAFISATSSVPIQPLVDLSGNPLTVPPNWNSYENDTKLNMVVEIPSPEPDLTKPLPTIPEEPSQTIWLPFPGTGINGWDYPPTPTTAKVDQAEPDVNCSVSQSNFCSVLITGAMSVYFVANWLVWNVNHYD